MVPHENVSSCTLNNMEKSKIKQFIYISKIIVPDLTMSNYQMSCLASGLDELSSPPKIMLC